MPEWGSATSPRIPLRFFFALKSQGWSRLFIFSFVLLSGAGLATYRILLRRYFAARRAAGYYARSVLLIGLPDALRQVAGYFTGWITDDLGVTPNITYTGGDRGWVGDSPFIFLDCSKIRSLGWAPALSIREGIIRTLASLQANPWLLQTRA